jgi:hypothetical protein
MTSKSQTCMNMCGVCIRHTHTHTQRRAQVYEEYAYRHSETCINRRGAPDFPKVGNVLM